MAHEHHYSVTNIWQGNKEEGNKNIRTYDRSHIIQNQGKPDLHLTTDNAAVGDKSKLNPEDLLVSTISSCHMLSYIYLCSLDGIIVTEYTDHATGIMVENTGGGGQLVPKGIVVPVQFPPGFVALGVAFNKAVVVVTQVLVDVRYEPPPPPPG